MEEEGNVMVKARARAEDQLRTVKSQMEDSLVLLLIIINH